MPVSQMSKEEWWLKEKRDYFFRAVISFLIQTPEMPLEKCFTKARIITDKAFLVYPKSDEQELPL